MFCLPQEDVDKQSTLCLSITLTSDLIAYYIIEIKKPFLVVPRGLSMMFLRDISEQLCFNTMLMLLTAPIRQEV